MFSYWCMGSRTRKIEQLTNFLYTLVGSVLMLLAILWIYFQVGSTDIQVLHTVKFDMTGQHTMVSLSLR